MCCPTAASRKEGPPPWIVAARVGTETESDEKEGTTTWEWMIHRTNRRARHFEHDHEKPSEAECSQEER